MKRNEADNDDCEPVEEAKEEVKTKRKCVKLDHDIAKLKEKELEMRTVKFKLTNVRAAGSVNAEEFILPDYYDIKKFVGNGGYGIVVMAVDKRFNSLVAIKRIRNVIIIISLSTQSGKTRSKHFGKLKC